MGIFDFLKRKKPELEKEETKKTLEKQVELEYPEIGRKFIEENCSLCKETIGHAKYIKKSGIFFHKKCYRIKYKELKKEFGVSA